MLAAQRLRKSWHSTLRLILIGELTARKNDSDRWVVKLATVEDYLAKHPSPEQGDTER